MEQQSELDGNCGFSTSLMLSVPRTPKEVLLRTKCVVKYNTEVLLHITGPTLQSRDYATHVPQTMDCESVTTSKSPKLPCRKYLKCNLVYSHRQVPRSVFRTASMLYEKINLHEKPGRGDCVE